MVIPKDINSSILVMDIIECKDGYFRFSFFKDLKILEVNKIILLDYNGNRIWDKTYGASNN